MDWAELPRRLRAYIVFLVVIAAPVVIWATWNLFVNPPELYWLVLVALTLVTVPICHLFLSFNTAITIGDAYIMAIAMMYGVPPCIVATVVYIFLISLIAQRPRPKKHSHKIVFNTASTVCAALVYSTIYQVLNQGSSQLQNIIIPALALAIAFFTVNSILTSIAIAWEGGEKVFRFWAKMCLPLAFDYTLYGLAATIIVASRTFYWWMPLAVAPLTFAVWAWIRLNKHRLAERDRHIEDQEQLYRRTVESLALAVDAKDQTTYGHIRRVRAYATGLAKLCGITDREETKAIETGALLHDIGKIAVEDYILNKPGRLSKQEFEKIKIHAVAGDEILQQVQFPFPVAKYVRSHHERWDGLGYPDGLKGEDIPLAARILAVSDAFDAIRFSRPYKLSMSTDEAIEVLRNQSGIVYDPKLVKLFVDHIDELEDTATKESQNAPELSFRKYFEASDPGVSVESPDFLLHRDLPAELVHLAEFCSTVAGYLDLNDILSIFSRRMQQIVPFSTCAFYLSDGNNRIAASYVRGSFSDLLKGHVIEIGKGISGWAVAYKRPMINSGPALDFLGIHEDFSSLTDALVVPIIHEDETIGTISLYAQEPISYSERDLNNLQMMAALLALPISESKKNKALALEQAVDPATRIHRISYLTAIGPQLISLASKNRSPLSLIYFEIRNLPQIIRIFGSPMGNTILPRIADCVRSELRETDVLVRYGHQGFVALLPGVRDDQALRCIQRLKQQVNREFSNAGQGFAVELTAGVSFYPKNGVTVFGLLQSAQENMRSAIGEEASSDGNVVDFPPRA